MAQKKRLMIASQGGLLPTRRRFFTGLAAAILGGVTYRYLSADMELKVLDVVNSSNRSPVSSSHYGLFGSRTLEIFFPEVHDTNTYGQRQRMSNLSRALTSEGMPFVAAGLEGLIHGLRTSREISHLIDGYGSMPGRLMGMYPRLTYSVFLREQVGHNDLRQTVASFEGLWAEGMSILAQYHTCNYGLGSSELGGRINAPGRHFYDLFPSSFGLEDYSADRLANYAIAYHELTLMARRLREYQQRLPGWIRGSSSTSNNSDTDFSQSFGSYLVNFIAVFEEAREDCKSHIPSSHLERLDREIQTIPPKH
ncbi:MAG TPA: hypothetical protein VJH22_02145 [Candidatus Nanoarchaeia archaeon]|nr:hypothetical protein [Candidatus Nanoarchaeia archaeon]